MRQTHICTYRTSHQETSIEWDWFWWRYCLDLDTHTHTHTHTHAHTHTHLIQYRGSVPCRDLWGCTLRKIIEFNQLSHSFPYSYVKPQHGQISNQSYIGTFYIFVNGCIAKNICYIVHLFERYLYYCLIYLRSPPQPTFQYFRNRKRKSIARDWTKEHSKADNFEFVPSTWVQGRRAAGSFANSTGCKLYTYSSGAP